MIRLLVALTLLCSVSAASEPQPTPADMRDATWAIIELRKDNAKLLQMVERLTEQVARLEQIRGETSEVPEIALMKKVPGQWTTVNGIPVYARSAWLRRRFGHAEVIELIRDGITPVPIGAVIYDGGSSGSSPEPYVSTPESANRLYRQSQQLRP